MTESAPRVSCASFPYVCGISPFVLILGSMPGRESLRLARYYANPRNNFWRIMGDLGLCDPAAPYDDRLRAVSACGVALWDVLARCVRRGSLDSGIAAPEPNPVGDLLSAHPSIRTVLCNGGAAHAYFRMFFPAAERACLVLRLPSTSPAAAMFSYEEKLARWRAAWYAAQKGVGK